MRSRSLLSLLVVGGVLLLLLLSADDVGVRAACHGPRASSNSANCENEPRIPTEWSNDERRLSTSLCELLLQRELDFPNAQLQELMWPYQKHSRRFFENVAAHVFAAPDSVCRPPSKAAMERFGVEKAQRKDVLKNSKTPQRWLTFLVRQAHPACVLEAMVLKRFYPSLLGYDEQETRFLFDGSPGDEDAQQLGSGDDTNKDEVAPPVTSKSVADEANLGVVGVIKACGKGIADAVWRFVGFFAKAIKLVYYGVHNLLVSQYRWKTIWCRVRRFFSGGNLFAKRQRLISTVLHDDSGDAAARHDEKKEVRELTEAERYLVKVMQVPQKRSEKQLRACDTDLGSCSSKASKADEAGFLGLRRTYAAIEKLYREFWGSLSTAERVALVCQVLAQTSISFFFTPLVDFKQIMEWSLRYGGLSSLVRRVKTASKAAAQRSAAVDAGVINEMIEPPAKDEAIDEKIQRALDRWESSKFAAGAHTTKQTNFFYRQTPASLDDVTLSHQEKEYAASAMFDQYDQPSLATDSVDVDDIAASVL